MIQTAIYEQHNAPITYFGVAYEFTQEDQERFSAMRQQLSEQLGDSIYLAPASTLHISIAHITAAKDGDVHYKEYSNFYEKYQQEYIATLTEATKNLSPFTVEFYKLEASSQAVIARAKANEEISVIREALSPLPKLDGRNIELGFIHSTQARYRKSVALEDIRQKIEHISFTATLQVNTIHLVRTVKEPMATHTLLQSFPLQPRQPYKR